MMLKDTLFLLDRAWATLGRDIMICELGNQHMEGPEPIAKKFLLANGATEHTSIDLNGQDGALMIDLRDDITRDHPQFHRHFDLTTNFGCSEHVSSQYNAFRNIHNLTREGGLMIHALPLIGSWPRHCRNRYSGDFPRLLAAANGYDILQDGIIHGSWFPVFPRSTGTARPGSLKYT